MMTKITIAKHKHRKTTSIFQFYLQIITSPNIHFYVIRQFILNKIICCFNVICVWVICFPQITSILYILYCYHACNLLEKQIIALFISWLLRLNACLLCTCVTLDPAKLNL